MPGIKGGLFGVLKFKQQDSDAEVSWVPIRLTEQTAFIQGYILYWSDSNDENSSFSVSTGIVTPSYFQTMGYK